MAVLLSDPFLLWPTDHSVRVVWFTEFAGANHRVLYGQGLERSAGAATTKMSRLGEDARSHWRETVFRRTDRSIWRHQAEVGPLVTNERLPYKVVSEAGGELIESAVFTLAPAPRPGTPLKILLTSDHQVLPMVAANLEMVERTVGRVDGVFFAGDLVNVPDRASEWFDDSRGNGFFPCLQGRATYYLNAQIYRGGALIQHAPLFPAIGNHEVMGIHEPDGAELNLSVARSRKAASTLFARLDSDGIRDQSFNTITYSEIFGCPSYYARSFGDIRLVALYATRIWRSPEPGTTGKYSERPEDIEDPSRWGGGEFIFEPIERGSPQYTWLAAELESEAFRSAKCRVVMLHHPLHGLGGNIVPAYTDPVPVLKETMSYEYPIATDSLIRDIEPLLEAAGVHLVHFGHSHLWNRFRSARGTHFLETANVGNTFGAHPPGRPRVPLPTGEDYRATGDPNGLEPVLPTLDPLADENGLPLPYLASNEITAFSLLDTASRRVTSYRFDTRAKTSTVIPFDTFTLGLIEG